MNGERLLKSMRCIREWARCAVERIPPFGSNYKAALDCILAEADAAVKEEGGEGKEAR